jgi:hypothetical protein
MYNPAAEATGANAAKVSPRFAQSKNVGKVVRDDVMPECRHVEHAQQQLGLHVQGKAFQWWREPITSFHACCFGNLTN